MLLTRIESESGAQPSAPAARPRFRRHAGAKVPTMDRRAFLQRSGLAAGAGAFASQLPLGVIGRADAAAEGSGRQDRGQAHGMHALLGRLRGRRGGRERRLDPAGAGVRSRRSTLVRTAPRAPACASTASSRFAPAEVADEAGQRQVAERFPGTRRSRKSSERLLAIRKKGHAGPTRCSGSAAPSTATSSRTCCASSCPSGAPTTATTRRASATRRRSPA